ncbi:MAG: DUF2283 domain-containing protein [Chloroflexi bacterium]|nr:DUF2283 domain-containing protein [Chloroflexota bacterium]
MAVRMGNLSFDHASYDAASDVLYLHIGKPRPAEDAEETAEGHVLRYDEHGRVIGVTVVNARWVLEREGAITVTVPQPQLRIEAGDLAKALELAGLTELR